MERTRPSRYDRHFLLPDIGEEGQRKLSKGGALIVGAGGLGSPVALYLAAAGVGRLGLVDPDRVEITNLQRQILHFTADLDREKVASAREKVAALNPGIDIQTYRTALDAENAEALLGPYDVAVGCMDNFVARYALNAACVKLGRPNVFGAASGFEGQAGVFVFPGGPCYRCFFREPPPSDWRPSDAEKGVLSTVPGVIGCIQATEAIKLLLGIGSSLGGRLLLYDALHMRFREVAMRRDPECPTCGRAAKG